VAGQNAAVFNGVAGQVALSATAPAATQAGIQIGQSGQTAWQIYQPASSSDLRFFSSLDRVVLTTAGNVTIAAPTSGVALTVSTSAAGQGLNLISNAAAGASNWGVVVQGATGAARDIFQAQQNGVSNGFSVKYDGTQMQYAFTNGNITVGAPVSGASLAIATVGGTGVGLTIDANPVYAGIPQNLQSGTTYTLLLADANKHINGSSASAKTFTIPGNASVAYPIGTAITFVTSGGGIMTIAITTDTLFFSSTGGTGSRTLANAGIATALKVATNTWYISGAGLT